MPVLFYIHGGGPFDHTSNELLAVLILYTGYTFGNPATYPFDGWVHQSPNVIAVSVYYRLDSFGFLSIPEFEDDSSLGDLNAGFTDQVQALRWVQQNIAAFGGDPNRVTIDGQSAGGSSVELHVLANQEKLFSGAIAQSIYRTPLPSPAQQKVSIGVNMIVHFVHPKLNCSHCLITMLSKPVAGPAPSRTKWHVCATPVSVLWLVPRMPLITICMFLKLDNSRVVADHGRVALACTTCSIRYWVVTFAMSSLR